MSCAEHCPPSLEGLFPKTHNRMHPNNCPVALMMSAAALLGGLAELPPALVGKALAMGCVGFGLRKL